MTDFGVPADDGYGGYLRMYLDTMVAAQRLAFDVIRAGAAGNPLAMLEAAGDYLNNVDAVDDEGIALYEQARTALGAATTGDTAQRDRFVEVLVDMRKKGVIVLDRAKWERYLPDDDDGRWVAYVPFAPLLPAEVEAHYAAHPEARERDEAHARELLAQLQDERRG